jgi:hypothetical protein
MIQAINPLTKDKFDNQPVISYTTTELDSSEEHSCDNSSGL